MEQTKLDIINIDNGGANAQKGFNYQDALAMLIIITNFSKNDFCIYLECRDDLEVDLTEQKIFIQVKSTKQSVATLLRQNKKRDGTYNKSTLYKNLNKSCNDKLNKYKIVTTSYPEGKSTIKGEIFKELYQYTDEQKKLIVETLLQQGLKKEELEQKLKNSYVYVSPFDDNLDVALTYLLGVMAEEGISVDNDRGRLLLCELLTDIHKKAEKRIITPSDIEKKKLKKDELIKLAKVEKCYKYMEEITTKLDNAGIINFDDKIRINEYIRVVDLKHKSEYKLVDDSITDSELSGNPEQVIKVLHDKLISLNINSNLLYAILIDKYVMLAFYKEKII